MTRYSCRTMTLLAAALVMGACSTAPTRPAATVAEQSAPAASVDGAICTGFGPQTPRDIDQTGGSNQRLFSMAPDYPNLNLCNVHFHQNAEHKAKDFSIYAGPGDNGVGGGYRCNMSTSLSAAELAQPTGKICHGLKPGDTIEVHWVYSSCEVKPGATLGACLSDSCANPQLRVETQVFTLVNDASAMNFNDFDYGNTIVNGYHQAKALPQGTGSPVQFLGSTTGPKYNESVCSPLQVSWSVRPMCAKLDINSIGRWCESNAFDEDHAHGVRALVTEPSLLSEIK